MLRHKIEVERILEQQGVAWEFIDDKRYKEVVSKWRNTFENSLANKCYLGKTGAAVEKLETTLLFTGYIFNLPNYKYLPVTPSAHEPSYGYTVENMEVIDRSTLNRAEAILTDINFRFTCVFNHEGESMIPEIFVEV